MLPPLGVGIARDGPIEIMSQSQFPMKVGPQVCSSNMYQNKEKNMNLNYDASTFMF
jgi:hypothetical protein